MPTLLTAGGLTVGAQIVSATDGAITIQSGPDGSKVNALAFAADGTPTFNKPFAVGVSQTWQNVAGSRAIGTPYTNSTGRPITVFVSVYATNSHALTLTIDGVALVSNATTTLAASITAVIPAGSTYTVTDGGTSPTIQSWAELR